jgi:predicted DNA-binding transcriptional regulator AlpA
MADPKECEGSVGEGYWATKQCAQFLGVDQCWVRRRAREGRLPYRRLNGLLRFNAAEIREWADRQPGKRLDEEQRNGR